MVLLSSLPSLPSLTSLENNNLGMTEGNCNVPVAVDILFP